MWEILHPGEVSEAEVSPDQADELRRKWATKPGQLWLIDRHRIICSDCRDPAVVARLWAEGGPRFRTIWTDPPYGVDYASKNAYLNISGADQLLAIPGSTGTVLAVPKKPTCRHWLDAAMVPLRLVCDKRQKLQALTATIGYF